MENTSTKSNFNDLKNDLIDEGEQIKDNLQETYEAAKKNGQEYIDETVQYIEKNPLKATLFAGLIGMVLGIILRK